MSKKQKKLLIGSIIISLLVRIFFMKDISLDYTQFLSKWIDKMRELGSFKSLKYEIGDYNVPYMIILSIISLFKCNSMYLIKIVSIIFDYVCAIFGYKIVKNITNNVKYSLTCFIIMILLPTIIMNSSSWGQCDSIYSAFALISLYFLINKKYTISFIFLGISFAFKLQFIFILPVYIIMFFKERKIHIYHFLIIPLTNIIMCLPAVIAGRNIKSVLAIYFKQVEEYKQITMNFPNLYYFLKNDNMKPYFDIISKIGIIVSFSIFACMFLYLLIKRIKLDNKKILLLSIWSVVTATYFLPHMHERYMYIAELLSVVYFFAYREKKWIPLSINLISLIMYDGSLQGVYFLPVKLVSAIYTVFIIFFNIYTYKTINCKEDL